MNDILCNYSANILPNQVKISGKPVEDFQPEYGALFIAKLASGKKAPGFSPALYPVLPAKSELEPFPGKSETKTNKQTKSLLSREDG